MTERERLIELLRKDNCCIDFDCGKCMSKKLHCYPHNVADFLLANGVIVPPFSLGQTVYIIDWGGKVASYKIYDIRHTQNADKETYYCKAGEKGKNDIGFYDIQIGKTVFLTKEEAEAALKEKGGAE